jgi:signal peptidase I
MTAVLPVRGPGAAQTLPPAEDTRSAHDRSAGPARTLGLLAPWLVRGVIGLAVAVFALLAVGPHVLGYRTMTMLTGSMAPMIDPGDVAVVTPIAVQDVTEGMVITYHQPIGNRALVTHRVVEVERTPDGRVSVRTKGDANPAIDPWTATLEGDTAYQVRAVVPELGHVIQALRTPVLTQALLYGVPALLAGWMLLSIWAPATEPTTVTRDEEEQA